MSNSLNDIKWLRVKSPLDAYLYYKEQHPELPDIAIKNLVLSSFKINPPKEGATEEQKEAYREYLKYLKMKKEAEIIHKNQMKRLEKKEMKKELKKQNPNINMKKV